MSSLFGALTTAVSGLTSQSAAFSNISDNVANSQTTGYKETDTNFEDYLTTSNQVTNDSGFVTARPDYTNNVQGTISASTNATALAISGAGMFQVVQASTDTTNTETLGSTLEYTRDGNFSVDKNGYLVNDAGEALNGWLADPATGVVNQTSMQPIKINESSCAPVATSEVTLSANLPATPTTGTGTSTDPVSSTINVYDANGTSHAVSLSWAQTTTGSPDDWTVTVSSPDSTPATLGTAEVKFGSASGNAVGAGTIGSITNATGDLTSSTYSASGTATLGMNLDFGEGTQTVNLNLGTYGGSGGVTQYAGTSYTLNSISQDGIPPGSFSNVTTQSNGDIVANYSNGQSRTVAQVPLVNFANVDGLQKQDGQAYTATAQSGTALVETAATGGAGNLVTSSLEGSNVDIATQFTQMIVAQQAYSANSKIVTTANQMLQTTIDMKQ